MRASDGPWRSSRVGRGGARWLGRNRAIPTAPLPDLPHIGTADAEARCDYLRTSRGGKDLITQVFRIGLSAAPRHLPLRRKGRIRQEVRQSRLCNIGNTTSCVVSQGAGEVSWMAIHRTIFDS